MSLKDFLWIWTFFAILYAQETINGPGSPNEWQTWINDITVQRTNDLKSINYNASIFTVAGLDWTQSTFIQPQMHGYDAYFYDINTHSYTLDKWLNDLKDRYGGIDSLLFWVTYTNIGADDRNQFDMNLAVPGGLNALKNMINYFHSQTPPIKVLFPYNPWDQGTRYSGNPDNVTMAKFLSETGGDGFNGDTMGSVPEDFYTISANTYNHPIAIEPEGGGSLNSLNWDTLGWGYWPVNNYQPNVGRWKWYESRHMTNICDRWAQNHTNDLQNAFFNGIGFESWENVWGCWNGIVPRDGEAIRRVATILRYFGNRQNDPSAQNFTQSTIWQPYIPIIEQSIYWNTVFASEFMVNKGNTKQQILYAIVNRGNMDINKLQIRFNDTFSIKQIYVYDCYHGIELGIEANNNQLTVYIDIEGLGYGCILATMDSRSDNKELDQFLSTMNAMTKKPLSSYSSQWKYLPQTMKEINSTKLYSSPPDTNMIEIPWGIFYFADTGVEIEGDDSQGVDVQFPWEMNPQKEHNKYMTLNPFYIDKYPITCSDYKKYLDSSKYQPSDKYNYLKNWNYDNTTKTYSYPTGYDNKPVTYLGLNEARLYCKWAGKRLPHSYEWQYAAQGNTSFNYPWGNAPNMGINFPYSQSGRTFPGPEDVNAFEPQGNSMFGVSDLVGNVWQYTDEFTDIHTRSVIVRGSANYRPAGSMWYFPTAYPVTEHNKYFLMDDSYERCGTIGFRCVADSVSKSINQKPMFWSGSGNYCKNGTSANGLLCGRISTGKGYNNLTMDGSIDWIQFGINSNDKSQFQMIRKNITTNIMYISNLTSKYNVFTYTGNPTGFYWNDGQNDIKVLNIDDSSTYGVLIKDGSFGFNVNNLESGNIYKLRIFAGVYKEEGIFNVSLNIDGSIQSTFEDNTIYDGDGTSNVCYELIIDLTSITNSKMIQLLINWIIAGGDGNITLQAIALHELLSKSYKKS